MSTKRGRELANRLARYIGFPDGIFETCSLIARHAVTHQHIQEGYCNGHPAADNPRLSIQDVGRIQDRYYAWLDKRDSQIERRITELVTTLPAMETGRIAVQFEGDPRGATVRLVLPDGREMSVL